MPNKRSKMCAVSTVGDCRLLPSGSKGVHKILMFTFRERVEKVNNDLIIPISFLHTFQFPIQFI